MHIYKVYAHIIATSQSQILCGVCVWRLCVCMQYGLCVNGISMVCAVLCMLQYVWYIVCIVWYGIYGMVYSVYSMVWYGIYGMVYMVWYIVCIVWYGIYGMVYVFMYSVHSSIVYGVCVCLVLVCMVYESSSAEMGD